MTLCHLNLQLIDFFKNQFLVTSNSDSDCDSDYDSESDSTFKIGLIVVNGIDSDSKMATGK